MKWNSFAAAIGLAVSSTVSVGFVNVAPQAIYGQDNRVDIYQIPRADLREVADSTVAVMTKQDLIFEGSFYRLVASHYGRDNNLCSTERFYNQPANAFCSGSLVGDDLVATAGHCIASSDCANVAFVFGYRMIGENAPPSRISASQVYGCRKVVARELTGNQDYALVRLDRSVRDHRPLSLQKTAVRSGDPLYVIGSPSGIPTKYADGASVRSLSKGFFKANLDTYAGNSGSAVFNARTNEVVGILVRGEDDFKYNRNNRCMESVRCTASGCRGEDVTNISYIVEALRKNR